MKINQEMSGICYEKGYQILQSAGVALIGISPGNSYFKQPIIEELIDFTTHIFSKIYIVIPDKPAEHTYKALGYSDHESEQRTRQQGNRVKNRVATSIKNLKKNSHNFLQVLHWQHDIETSSYYQEQLLYVNNLYKTHKEFCSDIQHEVKQVLEEHNEKRQEVTQENVAKGVHYLLEELACCLALPKMLHVENVAVVYHKELPLWNKFFNGYYEHKVYPIGLVIIS